MRIDTIVIGAGHAGLAVSKLLTDAQREHVVLERGSVAESWRSQRWDSLHLLTPAWLMRLPGDRYGAGDPGAFPSASQVAAHLAAYAAQAKAPVLTHAAVASVRRQHDRWYVCTEAGGWQADNVIVASGHATLAAVPPFAAGVPREVQQLDPLRYRRPGDVASGRVLVVGASASGVQIADELTAAGRDVTLAVGRHTRLPRRYRGRDIFWWLERGGQLDRSIDQMPDPQAAWREPSLQLTGRPGAPVELAALAARGIGLTGRVVSIADGHVHTASDLNASVAEADRRLTRLLDRIDVLAGGRGNPGGTRDRPAPVALQAGVPATWSLRGEGFGAVIWATGLRGDYTYLQVPGLEQDGRLRQYRGAAPAPGLYVIGQRFGHRRRSGFIDGARFDAADIVGAITGGSGGRLRRDCLASAR